jgi:trans-aconitate methyltransferase
LGGGSGRGEQKIAMASTAQENWGAGDPYELYVGRWSRKVALEFLEWISIPAKSAWVDIGCGTGALTQCILAQSDPQSIGVDKAERFFGRERGKPLSTLA